MWTNDRLAYRNFFYEAWAKRHDSKVLTPLEAELIDVIAVHPEYHFIFDDERLKEQDYFPGCGDINPFFHLSLHVGLREQLTTDRPKGILEVYTKLLQKKQERHQVEHLMMEQISEMMFQASRGQPLDDATYLASLKKLL